MIVNQRNQPATTLAFILTLTFTACSSENTDKKVDGADVSAAAITLPVPPLPESQTAFIRSIYSYKNKLEQSENPVRHQELARAFCASVVSREAKDWIAQLVEVRVGRTPGFSEKFSVTMKIGALAYRAERDGTGAFSVNDYDEKYKPTSVWIGSLSETFDRKREQIYGTWISENHPTFTTLANLNPGDLVKISGSFVPGLPIVAGAPQIEDYSFCLAINNQPTSRVAVESDFFGGNRYPSYGFKLESIEKYIPPSS